MRLINRNPQGQRLLEMIQEVYPNYHPLLAMAEVAHSEESDIQLRFAAHKEIASYIEPKLKTVEVIATLPDDYGRFGVVLENGSGEIVTDLIPPPSMYYNALPSNNQVDEVSEPDDASIQLDNLVTLAR